MPFNIANFNADISKSGIAATSQFEAWILGGPGSHYGISGILQQYGLNEGMRFRIEAVNMPGRQLQTLDQNYYGPVRRIPFRFSNQPVTLSVILSKDMREREIFMKWQDYFVGHYRTNVNRSVMQGMFDGKYYNDGIGTIDIVQYSYPNNNGGYGYYFQSEGGDYEVQNVITLEEAYPVNVNDIQLSWGDEGYGKLQVEIQYRYAIEENKNFGSGKNYEVERANRGKY
jgi:hypothetical protein